jgi:hypothetical protein
VHGHLGAIAQLVQLGEEGFVDEVAVDPPREVQQEVAHSGKAEKVIGV